MFKRRLKRYGLKAPGSKRHQIICRILDLSAKILMVIYALLRLLNISK